jgi:hypothetical protein
VHYRQAPSSPSATHALVAATVPPTAADTVRAPIYRHCRPHSQSSAYRRTARWSNSRYTTALRSYNDFMATKAITAGDVRLRKQKSLLEVSTRTAPHRVQRRTALKCIGSTSPLCAGAERLCCTLARQAAHAYCAVPTNYSRFALVDPKLPSAAQLMRCHQVCASVR